MKKFKVVLVAVAVALSIVTVHDVFAILPYSYGFESVPYPNG